MKRFTASVLGLLLPTLLLLSSAGVLFPGPISRAFSLGFDPARAALTSDLTRIMMPYIFFVSLMAFAGGVLNTCGSFAPAAAAPILLNVAIVAGAYVGHAFFEAPIYAVAWGVLVGGVAQLALQLPFLAKRSMLLAPIWAPSDPAVRTLARRMLPALFGVGVYQVALIITRVLASYFPAGQVSCYSFASRLQEVALGVFAVSIGVAALPTLSEHVARGDERAFRATLASSLRGTNFITVPSIVGLVVLGEPIVGALFRHGEFSAESAALTAELVRIMALYLLPAGILRIVVPAFYALGDVRTPVAAATVYMCLVGILGWPLGRLYEIRGLNAATVLAAAGQVLVLTWFLERRIRAAMTPASSATSETHSVEREPMRLASHALRCVLAVSPPAAIAYAIARSRDWLASGAAMNLAVVLALVVAVALAYFAIARLLGVPEVDLLVRVLRRRTTRLRRRP